MKELLSGFFVDAIKRFLATTPKFFKVVQVIALIVATATGLPMLIDSISEFLTPTGIQLPEVIHTFSNKIASIASLIAAFIAQLTVIPSEQNKLKLK